jgi:hypothetical protein
MIEKKEDIREGSGLSTLQGSNPHRPEQDPIANTLILCSDTPNAVMIASKDCSPTSEYVKKPS